MKTLILADVHANLAALEAVLQAEQSWDDVIFLGDAVICGPQPDEVLSVLRTMNGVFLKGNHDAEALATHIAPDEKDPHRLWIAWTACQLSAQNRRFLAGLADSCRIERQGRQVRLLHGDLPRALGGGRLWPDSPSEVFAALSAYYPEPVILIAHSHVQFRKDYGGTTFINPGTVGQPRLGQPLACYAVLEDGAFDLRAVPYDTAKTCRAMESVPLDADFVAAWVECYRTGVLPARYKFRDLAPLRAAGFR